MADMFDYLDWRGDIPLSVSPFNEVDNLILAHLSYVDLGGIVSDSPVAVPLAAVRESFFRRNSREKLADLGNFKAKSALLLDHLAEGGRFGNIQFCFYINELDADKTKQITAVTLLLDDGSAYVSFGGTDGSFTGWKEDLYLGFLPETEGQKRASDYLNRVASELSCPLRVGGHSKGANFAIYASALCPERDRITDVYANDGPGFREDFVSSEDYRRILPKIRSFIPDTSVIGLLLASAAENKVVKSCADGLSQHDGFTWNIRRDRFEEAELSATGKFIDRTLDGWIDGMDDETRRSLADTIFSTIESTGMETFHEMQTGLFKSADSMIGYVRALPKEKQKEVVRLVGQLILSGGHAVRSQFSFDKKQQK